MKEGARFPKGKKEWYKSEQARDLLRRIPTPQQRNQKLKQLFDFLPNLSVWEVRGNSVYYNKYAVEIIDTRTEDERQWESRRIQEVEKRRANSETRLVLSNRFKRAIKTSLLTVPARQHLASRFEELTISGIDRKEVIIDDHPVFGSIRKDAEHDIYAELFGWNEQNSKVPYTRNSAEICDRKLYRRLLRIAQGVQRQQEMLRDYETDEQLRKDEEKQKSERILEQTLPEEEQLRLKANDEQAEQWDREYEESQINRIQLLREWRPAHIRRFHNEP